ncbi:hypothetical protein [Chitinolyticbacter albus]|uniref:hypothetical protein n=1 Tax=Chitinolyticbacter albus TaxID=2961951 RepID=UPI00210B3976|nr:hypothetical protein [Chitinolyticbacter albus]
MNVNVARWRSRWSVPPDVLPRVPQIETALLDGELELGLAECTARHVGADEVVLVRRLSLPVSLSVGQSDAGVARQWGEALARELERQLIAGGTEILRYPHRLAAWLACTQDVLTGVSTRSWAWQRLGWLPRDAAPTLATVVQALRDEPELVQPWLTALFAAPRLPLLYARLDATSLALTLAMIARAQGLPNDPLFSGVLAIIRGTDPDMASTAMMPSLPPRWQRRWLALPELARAERVLWAVLIWLLAEPGLALRGASVLLGRAAALVDVAPGVVIAERALPDADGNGDGDGDGDGDLAAARGARAPVLESVHPDGVTAGHDDTAVARAVADSEIAVQRHAEAAAAGAVDDIAPTPAAERLGVLTEWGGLLFLVPLVASCGALTKLLGAASLAERPLGHVLHRLALQLLPGLRAHDAAALAFAGWTPDFRPLDEPWPQEAELVLAHAANLVRDSLAERLPGWAGPGLMARVCARRATVVADPGWFEVRFSLSEVSLDLRRAALDLDPGFVPWLGVVLRYVYE